MSFRNNSEFNGSRNQFIKELIDRVLDWTNNVLARENLNTLTDEDVGVIRYMAVRDEFEELKIVFQ